MASHKSCPQCQTPALLADVRCAHCGHQFRTRFIQPDYRTQIIPSEIGRQEIEARDRPNASLIAAMWITTAAAVFFGMQSGVPISPVTIGIDGASIVLAIILVCSRNKTDKSHGWIKLGLECISFVMAFMNSAYRASHPY